jgi:putative membrane protein
MLKGIAMKKILAALAGSTVMMFAVSALAETQTEAQPTAPATTATKPDANVATPATSAPVLLEGANSYTEAQARQRIIDLGFSDVSALAKDDKGIWRGTAAKSGKQTSIAVDFKGNVVAAN